MRLIKNRNSYENVLNVFIWKHKWVKKIFFSKNKRKKIIEIYFINIEKTKKKNWYD